jgi:hypothetical protein
MPTVRSTYYCLYFFFLAACQSNSTTGTDPVAEAGFSLDWEAIADKLQERMDLQPGERVLLVGQPGPFDALVPLIRERIVRAQGEDLGVISVGDQAPADWSTAFVAGAGGKTQEALVEYFQEVDLGIMLPGAVPMDAPYAALQEVLWQGRGRTIHFHWEGAYDLSGEPLPLDETINACYQKALLETDYAALAQAQKSFEEAMRGNVVQVTTPLGTDIRFEIGDRPVTRQDGDASAGRAAQARNLIDREIELPAGAIRVAPIETTVAGTIAFPDADWDGTMVKGLVLIFAAGKVVEWTADSGQEAVAAIFQEEGQAAQSFREFALGMNPLLAIPDGEKPWIPYYGYGAGVVRLSLGDNTELGGTVTGGFVRWNFFSDATVRVGEEVWVEEGKLVRNNLF